jgi:hypothetical protein
MILLLIAAAVAVAGIAFAVGRATAGTSGTTANGGNQRIGGGGRNFPSLAPGQTFNPGQFGGGSRGLGFGGSVSGTVQSISADSMTIELASGTTVTIDLSGTTTYHTETSASASDVSVGSSVQITINPTAQASGAPSPSASGGQTLTAKDVLIVTP